MPDTSLAGKAMVNWGVSSETELASLPLYLYAIHRGAEVLYMPTVTLNVDALYPESEKGGIPRFKLLSFSGGLPVFATRPLSNTLDEVKNLLQRLRGQHARIVGSLAITSISDAYQYYDAVKDYIAALEVDVPLSTILHGRGPSYIVEVIRELEETLSLNIIPKVDILNASILGEIHAVTNCDEVVLTPNMVVRWRGSLFRVHDAFATPPILTRMAESLYESDVKVSIVTQPQIGGEVGEMLGPVHSVLYDASILFEWLHVDVASTRTAEEPYFEWPVIDRRLSIEAVVPTRRCPYGLFEPEVSEAEAREKCNYCGVCLYLNPPGSVRLVRVMRPD